MRARWGGLTLLLGLKITHVLSPGPLSSQSPQVRTLPPSAASSQADRALLLGPSFLLLPSDSWDPWSLQAASCPQFLSHQPLGLPPDQMLCWTLSRLPPSVPISVFSFLCTVLSFCLCPSPRLSVFLSLPHCLWESVRCEHRLPLVPATHTFSMSPCSQQHRGKDY